MLRRDKYQPRVDFLGPTDPVALGEDVRPGHTWLKTVGADENSWVYYFRNAANDAWVDFRDLFDVGMAQHGNEYHTPDFSECPHGNECHDPDFSECPHGNECHTSDFITADDDKHSYLLQDNLSDGMQLGPTDFAVADSYVTLLNIGSAVKLIGGEILLPDSTGARVRVTVDGVATELPGETTWSTCLSIPNIIADTSLKIEIMRNTPQASMVKAMFWTK